MDYENYDTLAAVYAMKRAIGNDRDYLEFPRKALLDRIGMRNTLISTDRFGDFILSSQVYTNARDLARLGMLYLQNGHVERRAPALGVVDHVRANAGAINGAEATSTAVTSGWCRTTAPTSRRTPTRPTAIAASTR